MSLRWRVLGHVWHPKGDSPHARTHGAVPTPIALGPDRLRIFVTCFDEKGRGRPWWVDVDAGDPTRVLAESPAALLDLGRPGTFDDNGMYLTGVVDAGDGRWLFYTTGFELCEKIRYRMMPGLAVSTDQGLTMKRHSEAPMMDRTDGELFFRGGNFVMRDGGRWRMWYVAGDRFSDMGRNRLMPEYDIRTMDSPDGIRWSGTGKVCIAANGSDEHGVGRPWVLKNGPEDYEMFFSLRRRSVEAYRLGYARSKDGLHWSRDDAQMGLDVVPGTAYSNTIMFSAVIRAAGRTYCFFCGDHYGKDGFEVAVLEP